MVGSLGKLFVELGADTSGLEKGLDGAEDKVTGFGDKLKASGKAIGAGMTAAGVGIMALTDSSMKTNAALGTTAIQLGITTEEMRGLALETANVTFPLSEVQSSFDMLTRAGMTNADQIAASATAFDTLGDAIGLPASEVTSRLIPAFNAFGIPLEDAADHTDTFTHLMRNTTVELSDFSGMVNYLAADLDAMDMSLEESAAIMEVLADKGIQGSAATREFRTAISSASKAPEVFAKATKDLTKAEEKLIEVQYKQTAAVEKAKARMLEAADSPEKYAKAEERLAEVQRKSTIAISKAEMAVLDKKDAVAAAGTSQEAFYEELGITAEEVATYTEEITGAEGMTNEFADAQNKQFTTMDKLKHALSEATLQYGSLLEPVEALGPIMTTLGPIMIMASTMNWAHAASAWAAVAPYLAIVAPILIVVGVLVILEKKFGVVTKTINIVTGVFKDWVGVVKSVFGKVSSIINNFGSVFKNAGRNLMTAFANGITSGISDAVGAVEGALGTIRSYLPFSDAKVGPLSNLTASGAALMTTFEKGMDSVDLSGTMEHILLQPVAAPAAASGQAGGSVSNSSTINIGDIHLSRDYDFNALMKDIDRHQAQNRTQRGVRG